MSFFDGLDIVAIYTFWAAVLCLPLALFKRVRPFLGIAIMYLSYMWGLWLWIVAFRHLLSNWGWLPVIVGIFLGGVGVVPVAMFMSLIHGRFRDFFFLLITVVIVLGSRLLAQWMVGRSDASD